MLCVADRCSVWLTEPIFSQMRLHWPGKSTCLEMMTAVSMFVAVLNVKVKW